jgi:pimeloyl-ACP methyl ester carboxylesterase
VYHVCAAAVVFFGAAAAAAAAAVCPIMQCAGFLPNDPQYADLLQEARVDVPALFITGAADALIPPHRSKVRGVWLMCWGEQFLRCGGWLHAVDVDGANCEGCCCNSWCGVAVVVVHSLTVD